MRHESRLNARQKDGATARDYYEHSAHRNAEARAALEGPECPEALEYLLGWAYELHGRSGLSEVGVAPLSYATLAEWARFRGVALEWWEVEALLRLDAELRHPSEDETGEAEEAPPVPVWPKRKVTDGR